MKTEILSDLIIEGVAHIAIIYTEEGSKGKRCGRERWAIIQKFEGETVYRSKGKEYLSDKNHMVILPKGCSYEWECKKAGRFCTIEFLSPLTCDEILYFYDIDGDAIRSRMQAMERQRNAGSELYRIEAIKDTYSLILKLLSYDKKRYTPSEKAKKFRINDKCIECPLRPICKTCAASAWLETGDYDGLPEYLCRYAGEYKKLLLKEIEKMTEM